jgi:hypothetical protein
MIEFEFCFKVLRESIWVVKLNASSFADRPKLTSAFRKLIKRAGDDLDHLGGARVFAPSEDMMGGFLNGPPAPWIYLSPGLDKCSQTSVDYTVAHEFAHAITYATGAALVSTQCVCGAGDDCLCAECECDGCRTLDFEMTPDALKTAEEYVNHGPEYAADELVLRWGYKLPAWKAKVRAPRAGEQVAERVRDDGDQLALPLAGS